MKPILFFTCFLLICACQRKFQLSGDQFYFQRKAALLPADTLLRTFNEGVYVLKICTRQIKVDGHLITSFESCPPAQLDADSVNKTIYLMFFEGNRVLYCSGRVVFESKKGVREANDLRNAPIDLGNPKNRDRQLLRGYYYVEPTAAFPGTESVFIVHMQLEKFNKELVYLQLRYEHTDSLQNACLTMEEAGFSEKDEYDLNDFGPVMKNVGEIFHSKLEFFFCDTIPPKLVLNGASNQLWPVATGSGLSVDDPVRAVNQALRW